MIAFAYCSQNKEEIMTWISPQPDPVPHPGPEPSPIPDPVPSPIPDPVPNPSPEPEPTLPMPPQVAPDEDRAA